MENHIFNGKIVELEDGEEAVSYRLKCNDDFYDIGNSERLILNANC